MNLKEMEDYCQDIISGKEFPDPNSVAVFCKEALDLLHTVSAVREQLGKPKDVVKILRDTLKGWDKEKEISMFRLGMREAYEHILILLTEEGKNETRTTR